jgi:hypothetical protein
MSNLPNSMSSSELSGWREWAKKSSTKPQQKLNSNLAPSLIQNGWEQFGTNHSPYRSCSSCRRIRR